MRKKIEILYKIKSVQREEETVKYEEEEDY